MFRVKRARSVIHSVAHHGVSALSWLHPRLGEEGKAQKIQEITYDFCSSKISTDGFQASAETERAFSALQETFERIGLAEEVFLSQLSNASITFGFFKGHWPNYCICRRRTERRTGTGTSKKQVINDVFSFAYFL